MELLQGHPSVSEDPAGTASLKRSRWGGFLKRWVHCQHVAVGLGSILRLITVGLSVIFNTLAQALLPLHINKLLALNA